MKPIFLAAAVLGVVGAIMCGAVGVHEWIYYAGHPHRTGVSGVMTLLAIGAAVGCAGVAVLALGLAQQFERLAKTSIRDPITR